MKQKDLMLLLIPSFIMVAAWVIFNIYHSSVSSTISENLNMQITPISPTFDTKEIEAIKKRDSINPTYEFKGASPTPLPILIASPSSTPIPSVSPTINSSSTSGGITTQ